MQGYNRRWGTRGVGRKDRVEREYRSILDLLSVEQRADYDTLKRYRYSRDEALRMIGRADLVSVSGLSCDKSRQRDTKVRIFQSEAQ